MKSQYERLIDLCGEVGVDWIEEGQYSGWVKVWVRLSEVDWKGSIKASSGTWESEWTLKGNGWDISERMKGMGYEVCSTSSNFHGDTYWIKVNGHRVGIGDKYVCEFRGDGEVLRCYGTDLRDSHGENRFAPYWGSGVSHSKGRRRGRGNGSWLVRYTDVMKWVGTHSVDNRMLVLMRQAVNDRDRIMHYQEDIQGLEEKLSGIERVREERLSKIRDAIRVVDLESEKVESIVGSLVECGCVVLEDRGFNIRSSDVLLREVASARDSISQYLNPDRNNFSVRNFSWVG